MQNVKVKGRCFQYDTEKYDVIIMQEKINNPYTYFYYVILRLSS